jgi:hypothetical protein
LLATLSLVTTMELADLFYYQTYLIEKQNGKKFSDCFKYETYDDITETVMFKSYQPLLQFMKKFGYCESDIDLVTLMITEKCEETIMNLFPYND